MPQPLKETELTKIGWSISSNRPHNHRGLKVAKNGRDVGGCRELGSSSRKEFQVAKGGHAVGVLAGTPMKVLALIRGRGWESDRVLTLGEEMAEDQLGIVSWR